MGSTITTFDGLLKERYIDSGKVEELTYPQNVLMGLLEKRGDTGMLGSAMPIPLITKNPQGVSGGFTTAQAGNSNIGTDQFLTTAGDYYGVVEIGDKVLMASRTNPGAFLENKVTEIDGLYETAMESLSLYSWGNGGQALGQIATLASTNFTLTNPTDIGNFERDMTIVASLGDGSSTSDALIDSGNSATISAVNRSTGALSITTGSISGLAVGHWLFRKGDFFGNTGTVVIKGVQAYIAATDAPPALWGVAAATRALDPQRYAGCRVDPAILSGLTYEARVKKLFAQMTSRFKAKPPTSVFFNPEDFDVLETNMASRGIRPLEDEDTQFGYTKIDVLGSREGLLRPSLPDRHRVRLAARRLVDLEHGRAASPADRRRFADAPTRCEHGLRVPAHQLPDPRLPRSEEQRPNPPELTRCPHPR